MQCIKSELKKMEYSNSKTDTTLVAHIFKQWFAVRVPDFMFVLLKICQWKAVEYLIFNTKNYTHTHTWKNMKGK